MIGGTGVVGVDESGGNCGSDVHLVCMMGLHHRRRYDDDFLWMTMAGIGGAGVSLGEEMEELGKKIDSLDGDYDCHRHDVEEGSVGNRKVLRLFVDKHGCP